ncbi:MAG: rRNA maturation RNase YbeY [Candidatus Eisenbacteria bacterium]|uniref:Endoribonuclease YbeY n=1 Tax=Eiseniibacteriota bacterium TaxID=2212470 RepID=A0A933W876_UNCEI|nr:rRNA maturation RNase YbeY [Candidatus Eisenbacteria bacterium]
MSIVLTPLFMRRALAARLRAPLRALVTLVLRRLGRRTGEIAVVLADDATTRALNRDWRGMDHATDVITFAYDEHEADADTRAVTGDLVVSMDRVRVQAKRWKVSEGEELARLVIHGALHLCGHDHMKAAERRVMRAYEDAAMSEGAAAIAALEKAWPKPSRTTPAPRATRPARPAKPAGPARRAKSPSRRPVVAKSRARKGH